MTTKAKDEIIGPGDAWWPLRTPLGDMVLAGDGEALHWVFLPGDARAGTLEKGRRGRPDSVATAEQQLEAYFAGALVHFALPLSPKGTEWQLRVWSALAEIPFGETVSYGAVASAAGKPRAARAVGRATHANPLPIVIPCHRVVGADGGLVGFGGGLDLKGALLAHEKKVLAGRLGAAKKPQ